MSNYEQPKSELMDPTMENSKNGQIFENPENLENLSKGQLKRLEKKAAKLKKFTAKMEKLKLTQAVIKDKKPTSINFENVEYTIDTKPGDKKDVTCPLPAKYSPVYVESTWNEWWQKLNFFKPKENHSGGENGSFVIIIPPPNVTGNLHLGHALTISIQDTIVRYHRMKGKSVLYNPGCDHAGIATQTVVEKKIWNTMGKTRLDLGREEFINNVYEWKDDKMQNIYNQLKRLGGSFDWTRPVFSMDKKCGKAVEKAFIDLHKEGLISRRYRMVNWSCALKSTISKIEVDKKEIKGPTYLKVPGYKSVKFGTLIYFAYKIFNPNDEKSDNELVVATTRIETMLADKAVAVNPNDERYKHLKGKFVLHPFNGEKLPILFDDFVDIEFGTGAVKITPAHDPNDYECALRHNLDIVVLFTDDGLINDVGTSRFRGLKRFDCRLKVLQALKELNLFREEKHHEMTLNICSRSKDVIEPMLKAQWYLDCKTMSEKAMQVVNDGELEIIPACFKKVWFKWLNNCEDWCISRQLWWGHRIPVYFVDIQGKEGDEMDGDLWISAYSKEEALKIACKKFNLPPDEITLTHDQDVLDTWFSAALFPMSFFGWPDSPDFNKFYPTNLLETGHDILFFWVARMVMMCTKLSGKIPFKQVYLHAMIRDAHGRKMSKSLGNVVDPTDVITGASLEKLGETLKNGLLTEAEVKKAQQGQKRDFPNGIPQCGADAMRFSLCAYTTQARDINLDVLRVRGARCFCNKIWNATRLCLSFFEQHLKPFHSLSINDSNFLKTPVNKWILTQLSDTIVQANDSFERYNFTQLTTCIHLFWLYKFCDVYLEYAKTTCRQQNSQKHLEMVFVCLKTSLLLLHPVMPYITEELYQRIAIYDLDRVESITIAPYPINLNINYEEECRQVKIVMELVKKVRSIAAAKEYVKGINVVFFVADEMKMLCINYKTLLEACCRVQVMSFVNMNDVENLLEKLDSDEFLQQYRDDCFIRISQGFKLK